ncbi:alpha/beta hydrolase-fold protein [Flavobacterium sp.]|uniref:alpha/beta hydrolase n=1 Tax=Flavobacterium sp. TaxID=239 RepID=UPI00286EA592|nr:alpha/beta hydrolase-fold protein [Flavobacterium sp.]
MKNTVLSIVFLFSTVTFSQTIERIRSEKLNSTREITVKLPASYKADSERKYPLVLVLDSEYLFKPFEGNIAYGNYWDDTPEVIIVGINQNKNEERYDDSEIDGASGLPVKKGGAFFEFIGGELLPHLEKKYPVSNFKIIAGLDSTAGFLNTFLYKDIPLFNGYISLSPDLATGMEERIAARLSAFKKPVYYYHATSDGDLKKFQLKIKALDANIKTVKNPMLNYKFDDFKNASHYSLVLNAIPNALYQIFSVYKPISSIEYNDKIVVLKEGYADYLKNKYDTIEKALGIKMNVRLSDFKVIETAILKNEAYTEFEQLAQISGQQYPKSMMYDYHMAMYYEKRNELPRALKNYQNAFIKEEIGDLTKDMMLNKAEEIKGKLPKKIKGNRKAVVEEVPTETPTEVPSEVPAETPTEEQKPK